MSISMHDFDGDLSLTFECGEQPADEAITGSGHEPNGYFWEGLVQFAWPDLAERLEFDSEGGLFAANGSKEDLDALNAVIEPVLSSPEKVTVIITRAETAGFRFDD